MVAILNLLMSLAYSSNSDSALELITQAAGNTDFFNETFQLSDMEQNKDGDWLIPRRIDGIESVTLSGNIVSKSNTDGWYCAGGGLMFETQKSDGTTAFAYRGYTFNRDTSEVTVDFTDLANLEYENNENAYYDSLVTPNNFIVSVVWWTESDNTSPDDIELTLESVTIHYTEKNADGNVRIMSYSDVFSDIPERLAGMSSFYIVTDKNGNLVAINNGNLTDKIDEENAASLAADALEKNSGTVHANSEYRYLVTENDGMKIIAFVHKGSESSNMRQLLVVSIISAVLIFAVLFVIIVIISGKVVQPVSDTFEKQKQFISNAGHELKTPITVISATTELLEKKHGGDRWTETIKAQSEKMSRLVSELLELSRLSETANNKLQFSEFDLSETVSNTLLYFESRAFEENHAINADISENITMYGDEVKIERLVGILADNALKYSDEGCEITFALRQNKDCVCLTCSNVCRELKNDDINRLFERFYRREESHSNEREGFGLGLSIAQAITELHNGSISASVSDGIVTFEVKLPL